MDRHFQVSVLIFILCYASQYNYVNCDTEAPLKNGSVNSRPAQHTMKVAEDKTKLKDMDPSKNANPDDQEERSPRCSSEPKRYLNHEDANRVAEYFLNEGPLRGHSHFFRGSNSYYPTNNDDRSGNNDYGTPYGYGGDNQNDYANTDSDASYDSAYSSPDFDPSVGSYNSAGSMLRLPLGELLSSPLLPNISPSLIDTAPAQFYRTAADVLKNILRPLSPQPPRPTPPKNIVGKPPKVNGNNPIPNRKYSGRQHSPTVGGPNMNRGSNNYQYHGGNNGQYPGINSLSSMQPYYNPLPHNIYPHSPMNAYGPLPTSFILRLVPGLPPNYNFPVQTSHGTVGSPYQPPSQYERNFPVVGAPRKGGPTNNKSSADDDSPLVGAPQKNGPSNSKQCNKGSPSLGSPKAKVEQQTQQPSTANKTEGSQKKQGSKTQETKGKEE